MLPKLILLFESGLLFVVAGLASHRLIMVQRYYRNRKQEITPRRHLRTEELPKVCVQIPLFNEGAVGARIIKQLAELDYPKDKLEIQVLDDSTSTTCKNLNATATHHLRQQGFTAAHLCRDSRKGYKAGALAWGLTLCDADAEFVAVFDADFFPDGQFLQQTIHHFSDPNLAMVQCRWDHLNPESNLLTQAQAVLLDAHFQIEHTARARCGYYFNFNGTAGIWRIAAIAHAGGWQSDTLTEDLDLSYRAQLQGAEFRYLLENKVLAELPETLSAFRSQQHRWTKGSIEVFFKLQRQIRKAPISLSTKAEAFFHLAANFAYPLLLSLGLLLLPSLFALEQLGGIAVYRQTLWFSALQALFVLGFTAVLIFYYIASKESRPQALLQRLRSVALAVLVGIGLSLSNTIAVLEAVRGKKSAFARTPKTGSGIQMPTQASATAPRIWRPWLLYFEATLFVYFLITFVSALQRAQYHVLPLSCFFLLGYAMMAGLGLKERLQQVGIPATPRGCPSPQKT